jgi:hypothetical protein
MIPIMDSEMTRLLVEDRQREWRRQAAQDNLARLAAGARRSGLLGLTRSTRRATGRRQAVVPTDCEDAAA